VPLSASSSAERGRGPVEIDRVDGQRVTYVTANLESGVALGDAVERVRRALADLDAARRLRHPLRRPVRGAAGGARDFTIAILMALALVYMLMAAQFERFLDPLIVMLSVPMALIGVVPALLLTGTTLNIQSVMGLVMLIGIVVNNAIVLVDAINLLRREHGWARRGGRRGRPAAPAADPDDHRHHRARACCRSPSASGTGAEIQAPLARVVIGGLLASTLVTLVLIPVAPTLKTTEASAKPRMNFGKRYQTSIRLGRGAVGSRSTRATQYRATKNATSPIRMFWIILITAATRSASSPSSAPAATTAPVESIVPPEPRAGHRRLQPASFAIAGMKHHHQHGEDHRHADGEGQLLLLRPAGGAVAIAADTPHTEVAAATMMTRVFDGIFSHRVPKNHMKTITVGVTTQATIRPGAPRRRISENRISAPSSTSPVLMNISDLAPASSHSGRADGVRDDQTERERPERVLETDGLDRLLPGCDEGEDRQKEDHEVADDEGPPVLAHDPDAGRQQQRRDRARAGERRRHVGAEGGERVGDPVPRWGTSWMRPVIAPARMTTENQIAQ
jgi:hypothetical protein